MWADVEGTHYSGVTTRLMPLTAATLIRVPAARSGPSISHTVSSMASLPRPSTIGSRKVKVRRGALGSYFLDFEGLTKSPRVRRLQ